MEPAKLLQKMSKIMHLNSVGFIFLLHITFSVSQSKKTDWKHSKSRGKTLDTTGVGPFGLEIITGDSLAVDVRRLKRKVRKSWGYSPIYSVEVSGSLDPAGRPTRWVSLAKSIQMYNSRTHSAFWSRNSKYSIRQARSTHRVWCNVIKKNSDLNDATTYHTDINLT